MGKIYNIVFNSTLGVTANTSIESYYFNWSKLPQGKYICGFTFISGVLTLNNANVANVFIDLGCANNYIAQNPSGSGSFASSYIGSLLYSGTGSNTYLYADINTNNNFYLDSRPSNNQVTISILTNSATQGNAYTPATQSYTLTLTLELID